MIADYVHKDSKTINEEISSYEIKMPLINSEELQRIDNYYNEIVDEFVKQFVKEKDMIIAQQVMMNLRKENQDLKKQLESCYCNRTDCSSRIKNSKKYDSLVQKVENQQKEFIEWLEKESYRLSGDVLLNSAFIEVRTILSKYKEIIGGKE